MKGILKFFSIVAMLFMSGTALANAGQVGLHVNNSSGKEIEIYGGPTCNNCTTQSTFSFPAFGSGTSTATSNAGVTAMTYIIGYYGNYGSGATLAEKGCRATITLALDAVTGQFTSVLGASWVAFKGNPTCSTISPATIDAGGQFITWNVRLTAS